jgi:hypothetical protein
VSIAHDNLATVIPAEAAGREPETSNHRPWLLDCGLAARSQVLRRLRKLPCVRRPGMTTQCEENANGGVE